MAIVEGPLKQVMFLHMDAPNEPLPDGFAICDGSTLNSSQQDINPGGSYTLPNLLNKFILGADPTKAVSTPAATVASGNANVVAGAPGPGGIGGSNAYTLGLGEIPSHTHNGSTSGVPTVSLSDPGHTHTINDPGHFHAVSDPGHGHTATASNVGAHSHTVNDPTHAHALDGGFLVGNYSYPNGNVSSPVPGYPSQASTQGRVYASQTGITIAAGGAHTHDITLSTAQSGISVSSKTTGITISSASANVTGTISGLNIAVDNAGGGNPSDNRPSYFGLVPIMRVKA